MRSRIIEEPPKPTRSLESTGITNIIPVYEGKPSAPFCGGGVVSMGHVLTATYVILIFHYFEKN
eukprot:345619-Hanusia_phi.AAC.1